jgi:hypothetical protein
MLGEWGTGVTPAEVAKELEALLKPFLSSAGEDDGTLGISDLQKNWVISARMLSN